MLPAIAGVGFDLYVRLVGEAVATFRGDTDEAPVEIKIELPVDAHLPLLRYEQQPGAGEPSEDRRRDEPHHAGPLRR